MTEKLKLKGINSNKIPKEKKKKMEETLERMQKVREQDTLNLRGIIENKLKWAKENKSKTIEEIKVTMIDIKSKQLLLTQLNTIIPAFEELLGLPEKDTKEK